MSFDEISSEICLLTDDESAVAEIVAMQQVSSS